MHSPGARQDGLSLCVLLQESAADVTGREEARPTEAEPAAVEEGASPEPEPAPVCLLLFASLRARVPKSRSFSATRLRLRPPDAFQSGSLPNVCQFSTLPNHDWTIQKHITGLPVILDDHFRRG